MEYTDFWYRSIGLNTDFFPRVPRVWLERLGEKSSIPSIATHTPSTRVILFLLDLDGRLVHRLGVVLDHIKPPPTQS